VRAIVGHGRAARPPRLRVLVRGGLGPRAPTGSLTALSQLSDDTSARPLPLKGTGLEQGREKGLATVWGLVPTIIDKTKPPSAGSGRRSQGQ
jgi:hypothetical protein